MNTEQWEVMRLVMQRLSSNPAHRLSAKAAESLALEARTICDEFLRAGVLESSDAYEEAANVRQEAVTRYIRFTLGM